MVLLKDSDCFYNSLVFMELLGFPLWKVMIGIGLLKFDCQYKVFLLKLCLFLEAIESK